MLYAKQVDNQLKLGRLFVIRNNIPNRISDRLGVDSLFCLHIDIPKSITLLAVLAFNLLRFFSSLDGFFFSLTCLDSGFIGLSLSFFGRFN